MKNFNIKDFNASLQEAFDELVKLLFDGTGPFP